MPPDLRGFCNSILESMFLKKRFVYWMIAVGAALWSIWLARNDASFNNKRWSAEDLIFTIKMRGMSWIKARKGKDDQFEEEAWWLEPSSMCVAVSKRPYVSAWQPPKRGWIKLNIAASIFDGLGIVGFGGVLRNENGLILAMYVVRKESKNVDQLDLEAIRISFGLLSGSSWGIDSNLFVEPESKRVSEWCNNMQQRGSLNRNCFQIIDKERDKLQGLDFGYSNREANALASSLAVFEKSRMQPFVASWSAH